MAFLIDMGDVPEHHCNCALDFLAKAVSEDPNGTAVHDMWLPHPNPYLTAHVEDVTRRFQRILEAIQAAFSAALCGTPLTELRKADGPWMRMDEAKYEETVRYLESKSPRLYTLDDWMCLVDVLISRYLPDGVIQSEAEYLTIRAALLGKIQANMDNSRGPPNMPDMEFVVDVLPVSFGQLPPKILTPIEMSAIHIAKARAAENISDITAKARHQMRGLVIEHVTAQVYGMKEGRYTALRQTLFDNFGQLNRDFRRIAVTEAGECLLQGFIAAKKPGDKVRRQEAYRGVCSYCASLSGRVFTVVDPASPNKNGETEVWPGKTNIGRSASPRKRNGQTMVDRAKDEMFWPAAGTIHPNCFIDPKLPIYTATGWKPLADIAVGDSVLTHKGRFRPVTRVLSGRTYNGRVHGGNVVFDGRNKSPMPFSTGEHPFLTARGWTPSSDLKVGDKLVSLAKRCPTCERPFINLKFPHVQYCSIPCSPRPGINQFSTDDPEALAAAKAVTGAANTRRLQRMTVEQRRALTDAARAAQPVGGLARFISPEDRARGGRIAAANNYKASPTETAIGEMLEGLGCTVSLQHRVPQTGTDSKGRARYWWLDLALPEQRIAVEVDGEPWHGRLSGGRDAVRDADLKGQGWTVLRFPSTRAMAAPSEVAAEVARVAMNHDGAYVFGHLEIVRTHSHNARNATLYNFSVAEDESYIVGGGFVVHNCRGSWVSVTEARPEVSDEFKAWLEAKIAKAQRRTIPPSS